MRRSLGSPRLIFWNTNFDSTPVWVPAYMIGIDPVLWLCLVTKLKYFRTCAILSVCTTSSTSVSGIFETAMCQPYRYLAWSHWFVILYAVNPFTGPVDGVSGVLIGRDSHPVYIISTLHRSHTHTFSGHEILPCIRHHMRIVDLFLVSCLNGRRILRP